jgi:hypothetical protein
LRVTLRSMRESRIGARGVQPVALDAQRLPSSNERPGSEMLAGAQPRRF